MRRSSFSPKDYQSSLKGCEWVLRTLPFRCGRLEHVVQRNQQSCIKIKVVGGLTEDVPTVLEEKASESVTEPENELFYLVST